MKLGILGCLAGSAAAMLFTGCATDEEVASVDMYRSPYRTATTVTTTTEPTFVERRTVVVDNAPRQVAVYRTGDSYFYDYGGRRMMLSDYPGVRRTRVISRPAYSSARFRTVETPVVRTGYDEDESTVRRTIVTSPDLERTTTVRTTRTVDTPEVVGERVVEDTDMGPSTVINGRRIYEGK